MRKNLLALALWPGVYLHQLDKHLFQLGADLLAYLLLKKEVGSPKLLWRRKLTFSLEVMVTITSHAVLMAIGFSVGLLIHYPEATPPRILATILVSYVVGAYGLLGTMLANKGLGGLEIWSSKRLRNPKKEEDPTVPQPEYSYHASIWCDAAFWCLTVSLARVGMALFLHIGTI